MHRYSAASGVGVGNSVVSGASARENTRADSSLSSSSFSLGSRRHLQLASYKLKCDKEPLNSRLGPPDFFPQSPNCAEETLTREYLQSGYKETVAGIEMDLDCMEMPPTIRQRIQAAMPVLAPSLSLSAACHPPTLSSATLGAVQSSSISIIHQKFVPSARTSNNPPSRSKGIASQDVDLEIDPWTLLEDCTESVSALNMGGFRADNSILKACSWLKGAVRVRRTDLTYIGAMDEES